MSWLLNSSIGKKLIMSISGVALVLFLLFHAAMNFVATISADGYNMICAFLGSNWYAVAGTAVLGALVAVHFIYAFVLTIQNRKARGNDRYAVADRPKSVSWASQNMFVLGVIVIGFLLLHFFHFWYHMMFAELMGHHAVEVGGQTIATTDGAAFIKYYFSHLWVVVAYLVWYVALWFHLSHGFWSAMQSMGLNGRTWFNRWKKIGTIVATVIMAIFAYVTIFFYAQSILCPGC